MATFLPKLSKWSDVESYYIKVSNGIGEKNKKNAPGQKKQMLTELSCLAHYVKDKDNMLTTDASTH